MIAAIDHAVEAPAALRALFQQTHPPLFQTRQHIATDIGIESHSFLQVLVLVHETDLRRDPLQESSIRRGIRLVRHPRPEQQHADQPLGRSRNGHDQPHPEIVEPAVFALW
jgi:hypothetical protein